MTVEPDGTWPDVSDLMVASSSDGAWAARAFASGAQTGAAYMRPEIASSGRSTFLAWMDAHGTRIGAADNRTGTWVRKVFNTTGYNPRLAASAGRPFVAWQVPSSGTAPTRVFFAEQDAARVWTGTYASPVVATPQLLAAVAAVDGKATVVMMSPTRLYARTQQ